MRAILRRAIVPALLVIAGVAAIVEGVLFHSVPVLVEKETPVTIEIPLELPPVPGADGSSSPDGSPSPGGMPFGGLPTFIKKTVTRVDQVAIMMSEPELIRDVSVGGVIRLDTGELKRTYSGKGPALCPS